MNLKSKVKQPNFYLVAFGLFLVFIGIRINLILVYGSQTPYWDDWGMGTSLAKYIDSGFDYSWLYSLSNEHRAIFSKIINLLLLKVNNHQWDPYLTMVYDIFIWAISGIFLLYVGLREKDKINPWLLSILIIILWTYPLSLFNITSTIQTYLYHMVLFTVVGFWLVTYRVFSFKWFCGILLVGACTMTTGGGSFAPVAVTAVSAFLSIFNKQDRRQHLITTVAAGLFAIFGLYLILSQSGSINSDHSLGDLLNTLFKTLSWPNADKTWPSIILLLPIVLLALGVVRNKISHNRLTTYTLMMAAFGIMLAIAIAFARSTGGYGPAERYFDFLTILVISSALALMLIQSSNLKFPSLFNGALILLWLITFIAAAPFQLNVFQYRLDERINLVPIQDDIMARYSVSGDPELFEDRFFREVPFPHSSLLEKMVELQNKTDIMPYTLQHSRMELQIQDNTFTRNGIVKGKNLYRGLESVLGSYNLDLGAQNAMGEYTSEIFIARRPYIMIPVSGYLSFEGVSLKLVGEDNGKVVDVLARPIPVGGDNDWYNTLVKAPDKRFRIVAKDDSPILWFAYAAPRSVGRLSYFVERIIHKGPDFWKFGLLLLIIGFRHQIVSAVNFKAKENTHA